MLSRQIASKLGAYETPFYLYDMALLRQTLESVVYESKRYGYHLHYAIKANYDDRILATIREYRLGIDCASGYLFLNSLALFSFRDLINSLINISEETYRIFKFSLFSNK